MTELLNSVEFEDPVQAAARWLATTNHCGMANRQKVYELGEHRDERILCGCTRPFQRLKERLQKGLDPARVGTGLRRPVPRRDEGFLFQCAERSACACRPVGV